jgi:ABC-2 type transport system permease protein
LLLLALFKLNFIKSFQYRGAIIIKFIGSFIRLFVEISLWTALFKASPIVNGTTFNDMINYMSLTAILTLFSMSGPGNQLSDRIMNGSISSDMIRPYSLKPYLVSVSIGNNLFEFITFTLPVYTLVLLVYGPQIPTSPLQFLLFSISVLFGAVISFYFSYIMGMLSFWLQSTWYISWVQTAMFTLFGGTFVPLWFYPDFLIKISYVLPFRYITYEAVTFYLGRTSIHSMLHVLTIQLIWISVLAVLEAFLWNRAQKKIMVFGG